MGALSGQRIVHLTTVDLTLRYVLLPQMRAALKDGGEVVGLSAAGSHVEALKEEGIRHLILKGSTRSMSLRSDLTAAWELWKTLRRERPDVLHVHNPKPGIYGRIVGRLAGVPRVVSTTHGLYAQPGGGVFRLGVVAALEAIASRCADVNFYVNEEDYKFVVRFRIVPARRARYLGSGVDLQRFQASHPSKGERDSTRQTLGVASDTVLVGCVARLVEEKGIRELIEAVAGLGSPFRLVLVGDRDPQKRDALAEGFIEKARHGGVIFAGQRGDVEKLYRAMDVFCLASYREGVPQSLMEAAASGLPLVATDVRGCRQVVIDKVNGRLVPPRDVSAIMSALRHVAAPRRRSIYGEASRLIAESRFDESVVIERVLASYGIGHAMEEETGGPRHGLRRVRRAKRDGRRED